MFRSLFAQRPLPALPPLSGKAGRLAFLLLAVIPFLFGFMALYLGQDANWDFRNYHWYNGYAALTGRYDTDLLPSQLPFFYNPALDIPYYLLASNVPAKLAAFVLGSVQGLNFILLFMLCHATLIIPNPKQKVWACTALSLLGMLGGGGLSQLGTTFYDNITSLGLFASALMVIRFFPTMIAEKTSYRKAFALAALAGFPAGIMMGFKLPFAPFCVALCGALWLVTGPMKRRFWISFSFGIGVLIGLALSFAPWGYYLQTRFGSPLFPYFNTIFHSPYFPLVSFRDAKFVPETWRETLFYPYIFTSFPLRVGEIPWRDFRLPILYTLLPLCILVRLLFGRTKRAEDKLTDHRSARYLLWTATLSYLIWLPLFSIYRYLLPLEMLTPLLIVIVLGFLPIRPQIRALWTTVILIAIAVTVQAGDWGRHTPWLDNAVEVSLPADFHATNDLMILMAGQQPYAHVIPAFPASIPFVRIQSNICDPSDKDKKLNDLIQHKIDDHQGPFSLLIPDYDLAQADTSLAVFGLKRTKAKCQNVIDHLYDSRLVLCDVQPLTHRGPHE